MYGILKITIGIVACFIPDSEREKVQHIPFIKHFISGDTTLSGKMFDIALLVFGLYTLIHGLYMIRILPQRVKETILTRKMLYWLNGGLGVILTIYFILILYTNTPLPKNEEYTSRYMTEGLCSGLTFLITLPTLVIYHVIVDNGLKNAIMTESLLLLLCLFSIGVLAYFILRTVIKVIKSKHEGKTTFTDIASVMIIPLNSYT